MERPRPLPGLPEVTLQRGVPCRMRDGVTLYADVYRPEGAGPFPVILMRLPYDKTSAENITYSDPSWYARHGYLVVIQDVRGRCVSEGEFIPFLHEAADGYDTIEWAARLPGANGRVGMYGFSYAGATQLLPATLRPPSLATICPAMTASQYYEGWTYNQGALALAFTMSWATQLASGDARRARDDAALGQLDMAFAGVHGWHWFLPLSTYPPLAGAYGSYFADWLAHPAYDEFWQRWSIDADYSRLTTPALHIAGWYDVFLAGSIKNFLGLRDGAGTPEARSGQKLVIGPWLHMPWAPLSDSSSGVEPTVVDDLQIRWFDYFLKGEGDRRDGRTGEPLRHGRRGVARLSELAAARERAGALVPPLRGAGQLPISATGCSLRRRRARSRPTPSPTTPPTRSRASAGILAASDSSHRWGQPISAPPRS